MATTPSQYRTEVAYDDYGAVTRVEDPLDHATETTYDENGNVVKVRDADGHETETTYDELDRPVLVTRADLTKLSFGYDPAGNRNRVTDGLGHDTTSTHDVLGRVTAESDGRGRKTTFGYDDSGRLLTRKDHAGRTTTFGYDAASQLQTIAYSDGTTAGVDFDYDALGRRKQRVDGTGASTWTYDSLGRLKTAADGSGPTLTYTHDLGGNLTKIGYPAALVAQTAPPGQTVTDPSVIRGYDDAGRMTSVKDWLNSTTEFDYDLDGNLVEQRYPNGVKAAFTYDRAGQLERRTDASGTTTLLDLPYTRKPTGQVETQNLTGATPAATGTMSYDVRHQLTGVTGGGFTESYARDAGDRLTGMAGTNPAISLQYDDANQLQRTRDQATGALHTTFTYDGVGNRTVETPASGAAATT